MINPSAGYCTSLLCSDGQPCQYKIVNNPDGSQGGLCVDPGKGGVIRHRQVVIGFLTGDLLGYEGHQLRLQRVELFERGCQVFES